MKNKPVWLMLTTLILMVLAITIPGCTWFDTQTATKTLIQAVPESSSAFEDWDIDKLRNDKDLGAVYRKWRDDWSAWLEDLGIYYGDVKQVARIDGSTVRIISGDLNTDDITAKLAELEYKEGTNKGQERWENASLDQWVAFPAGLLLAGKKNDVEACLTVVNREETQIDSMWDNSRVQSVVGRLPAGVRTRIGTKTELNDAITAWGCVWQSGDQSTLRLKAVYRFDGTWAIDDAKEAIQNYWQAQNHYKVHLSESGQYLEVTGVIDIDDFQELLPKVS